MIAKLATDHDAVVVRRHGLEVLLVVRLFRSDGRRVDYRIVVTGVGSCIKAREEAPCRLPPFCPERHINLDSTFCMNWQDGEPIYVVDIKSARHWWATLLQFLRLQERAGRLQRWPDRRCWAHGNAAKYQKRAEDCAQALGPDFARDLQRDWLQIVRRTKSANGPSLRLYRNGQRVFSVWERFRRVVNLRRPCVCRQRKAGRRLPLCSCTNHAEAAAELALALHQRQVEEQRFWDAMKGRPCCGTIDGCPLKLGHGIASAERAARHLQGTNYEGAV